MGEYCSYAGSLKCKKHIVHWVQCKINRSSVYAKDAGPSWTECFLNPTAGTFQHQTVFMIIISMLYILYTRMSAKTGSGTFKLPHLTNALLQSMAVN